MTFQLPEDFKPITRQSIFDAAWQAFIVEQRAPAQVLSPASPDPDKPVYNCVYATEDGRRCAVGWAIPVGHPYESRCATIYELLREEVCNLANGNPEGIPPIFDPELVAEVARMESQLAALRDSEQDTTYDEARIEANQYESDIEALQSRLHDDLVDKCRWSVTLEEMKTIYREVAADYGLTAPEDKSKGKDIHPGDVLFDMHDYSGTLLDSGSRGFGTLQIIPGSMQHVYVPAASRIVQEIISHAAETECQYLNKTVVALGELYGNGEVQAIYAIDARRFAIITLRRPVVAVDEQEH